MTARSGKRKTEQLQLAYSTVVWSSSLIQDIEAVESVQRKFTEATWIVQLQLCGRFKRLELQSLELRCLHLDLIWCYKIVFECVNVNMSESFQLSSYTRTRGHQYKLYKPSFTHITVKLHFFSQRILNVCNSLPDSVDFTSLNRLHLNRLQSILSINLNDYLTCFKS